ncbi:transglutaminase domain-containing protein [Flavobacteriaceae bacterium LMO-SS05]
MKKTLIIFAVGFCLQNFAQDLDFGKVSQQELEEKFNTLDSSATATYLYKYRRTYFEYNESIGFQVITEIQERLKLYNANGFDHATHNVILYKEGSKNEKISNLKAITYNLVNGEIEEDKLSKDGIFETELDKYHDQTKFTMPNLKPGSIVEYRYRIYSPYVTLVRDYEFQFDIPVKLIDAKFETPEFFNFKVNTKGFLSIVPKVETKRDQIMFKATKEVKEGLHITQRARAASTYDFNKLITIYNLKEIPALREELFVNNIDNYRAAVNYELSYVKYPNSTIDYYTTTWEDVVKSIYQNSSFGSELDKSGYYEDDIDALIAGLSDPIQKASTIFNFVKSNVKWNGYYGKYTNQGVKSAYKEHVGSVGDINLMLTSMLRYAGLDANPVLVSTRSNGIPLFPTSEGYNYVISAVVLNNSIILLDATNRYSAPNILPFRTLNWQGRLIRKDGSSTLVDLYPNEQSQQIISLQFNLQDNGDIEGMIRRVKTNHDAMLFRQEYVESKKEQFLENLENKYNGLEISDYSVTNEMDLGKPTIESFKFFKENQVEIIGDKLFFSPLFFLTPSENPFKSEKREYPVDFGYPSGSKYRILVNLPKGYKLESVPEPIALALPDNLGTFKYIISPNENTLQLIIESEINESLISTLYYESLKEFYKKMIEKENEKIVLTKV